MRIESEEWSGYFWLREAPQVRVSGVLSLAPHEIVLRLNGMITSIAVVERRDVVAGEVLTKLRPRSFSEDSGLTVHGDLARDGASEPVTLLNGHTSSRSGHLMSFEIGEGFARQSISAAAMLRGKHTSGDDERFSGIRVSAANLVDWVAGWDVGGPAQELAGGGTIGIASRGNGDVWVEVQGLEPMTLSEIDRSVMTPLRTLTTLAADVEFPLSHVQLRGLESQTWLSLQLPALLAAQPVKDFERRRALLPFTAVGTRGIGRWLDRADVLGPLPPVVAAMVSRSPNLETGVLELATVAEGLARRLWPDDRQLSPDLASEVREAALGVLGNLDHPAQTVARAALQHLGEASYSQRLQRIAARAGEALPGVLGPWRNEVGEANRWKRMVVDARNAYAHQFQKGWRDQATFDRDLSVMLSLRWLLTGLLLLETGMEPVTLRGHMNMHQPYTLFLTQAADWHPRVYASPT